MSFRAKPEMEALGTKWSFSDSSRVVTRRAIPRTLKQTWAAVQAEVRPIETETKEWRQSLACIQLEELPRTNEWPPRWTRITEHDVGREFLVSGEREALQEIKGRIRQKKQPTFWQRMAVRAISLALGQWSFR